LFAEVAKLLRLQWSPEQIAGRRKRLEDGTDMSSGLRVSHEAIDQAIYAVPRQQFSMRLSRSCSWRRCLRCVELTEGLEGGLWAPGEL
jgi:IS30 family transposase